MVSIGISFVELPKTFQDAVRLARFLGIDYLWIDSLCIIQDSHDNKDWKQEAQSMADVYRHSVCNIAATASRAPAEGCFYPRNQLAVPALKLFLRQDIQKTQTTRITQRRLLPSLMRISDSFRRSRKNTPGSAANHEIKWDHLICFPSNAWRHNIEEAPLNKRAWVLQERLLAPRQIHCGRQQLFWECNQAQYSEHWPIELPLPSYVDRSNERSKELKKLDVIIARLIQLRQSMEDKNVMSRDCSGIPVVYVDTASKTTSTFYINLESRAVPSQELDITDEDTSRITRFRNARKEAYQCWEKIVELYSTCEMTYRTDKLVAISAVASRIQEGLKGLDAYVSGLWLSQLPHQLLWCRRSSSKPSPSYYDTAPSWSWASLTAGVTGPPTGGYETSMIEVLEVHNGSSIAGQVEADQDSITYLKLKCLLYKAYFGEYKMSYITVAPSESGSQSNYVRRKDAPIFLQEEYQMDGHGEELQSSQAYLMPVLKGDSETDAGRGLIVVAHQEKPGFFRRIGCWRPGTIGLGDIERFRQHLMAATEQDMITITLI
ncbi:hypothetical protein Hte_007890 [Hypoxylon texense]